MTDVGQMEHEAVRRAQEAASTDVQEFGNFFLSRFLGLEISYDDDEQTCSVRLPYARHLGNPQGSVHGGSSPPPWTSRWGTCATASFRPP